MPKTHASIGVPLPHAYLDALFRVLADANVGLVFRSAQQVQDVLVVDLELQTQSIDKPSA